MNAYVAEIIAGERLAEFRREAARARSVAAAHRAPQRLPTAGAHRRPSWAARLILPLMGRRGARTW